MTLSLQKHPSFAGRPGPVLVVVADGVGVAPAGPSNAVTAATTPTLDELTAGELYTELAAHGPSVGLPTDDDMGNSEVGHNALGAGRIFAQGAKLVNKALGNGAIFAAVTKADMQGIEILCPPKSLAVSAEDHFVPIHEEIGNLSRQIQNLRRTRDLLLPRLLSGQLELEVA